MQCSQAHWTTELFMEMGFIWQMFHQTHSRIIVVDCLYFFLFKPVFFVNISTDNCALGGYQYLSYRWIYFQSISPWSQYLALLSTPSFFKYSYPLISLTLCCLSFLLITNSFSVSLCVLAWSNASCYSGNLKISMV